jgi:hypothetical protein
MSSSVSAERRSVPLFFRRVRLAGLFRPGRFRPAVRRTRFFAVFREGRRVVRLRDRDVFRFAGRFGERRVVRFRTAGFLRFAVRRAGRFEGFRLSPRTRFFAMASSFREPRCGRSGSCRRGGATTLTYRSRTIPRV